MRRLALFAILLLVCAVIAQAESIPLRREGGTYVVPVLINDKIALNFTIDSGAADVSIPADVFSTLVRAGTVAKEDLMDKQVYRLADGSEQTSQRFRIRSLRVGSLELRDVTGSVAPAAGSLLLGQSFLSRIKSWSIDNERHLLLLNQPPTGDVASGTSAPRVTTAPAPARQGAAPDVDSDAFLKAVGFALTGEDGTHIKVVDLANCVFQFVFKSDFVGMPPAVITYHLNNVDPTRITIERREGGGVYVAGHDGELIDIKFTGEGVVRDVYYPQPYFINRSEKVPIRQWQHDTDIEITHYGEYERNVRVWKYIYSHGCKGRRRSF
jgi:clan AA aspartic protease (TIGR02281 family)